MDLDQGFQLDDLRGLVRRRGVGMAALFGATVLLFVLIAGWLPNSYRAETVLLVDPQTISKKLVESGVPETELNDRLHLLQMQILSRGRLSKVIDDLNVYPELEDEMTRAEVIEHMREQISLVPLLSELATEARAQTGIRPGDVSINTFQLRFEHRSATVAAEVANRLANSFIEEHLRERTQVSGDTAEFIQEELRRLTAEIARVEKEISDVKTANAGTLPEDFAANQRTHERLVDNLREVQRELTTAQSDEAFYHQQTLQGGGDEYYGGGFITPRRRLDMLEVQLAEHRARGFTDKHPDIVATLAEMERIKADLKSGAEDPNDLSMAQQNARAEMQRASLRVQSARQEGERLRAQLLQAEERLAKTPRVAEQLGSLEREHEHLFDAYQEYSKKRLEAGVAADMESRQKGEKFRVLEAAVPPPDPAAPNRPLLLALGALLGLALAGAYGLASEALDSSFHVPRRLQERFGIPVLAAIPEVVLPADLAARRARLVRSAALASAATIAVIAISAAGYLWQASRAGRAGPAQTAQPQQQGAPQAG
jgi:polysaccharide chain length determinant protein (PEP-CTERM system associated)